RDLMLVQGRLKEWARLRDEGDALNRAANARTVEAARTEPALVNLWIRRDTSRAIQDYQTALAERPTTHPQRLEAAAFFAMAGRPDLARGALSQYESAADTTARRRFAHLVHRARAAIANAERRTSESLDEARRGDVLPDGPVDQCEICLDA